MSNLNFKWGNHAGLPKSLAAQDVGALFFTKDEGALYLGVESGKAPRRIQGTVQYYADLTQFKSDVLPPYSADVIYYIASENALVKWSGEKIAADGNKTSGEFVVLNVTASEFTTKVSQLSGEIAANASDITTLSAQVGTNEKENTTAFGRIKSLEDSVTTLEGLLGLGGGTEGATIEQRIATLESWKTDIDSWKTTISNTVSTHTSEIGANASAISTNAAAIEGVAGRVTTAEGKITAAESNISNAQNDISGLKTRMGAAEGTIAGHTQTLATQGGDIATLQSAVEYLNENTIPGLDGRITDNATNISALEGRVGGHDTNISDLTGRMTAVEGVASSAKTTADKNKEDITGLTSTTEGLRTDLGQKTDGASASGSAFARIAQVKSDLSTLNTKVIGEGGLTSKVSTLEGEMDTAQSDISGLKTTTEQHTSDIGKNASAIAANTTAIGTKASQEALNALATRVGTAEGNISTNAAGISGINDKIGTSNDDKTKATVYGAIAKVASDLATEEGARTTLAGRVSTVEDLVGNADSAANASGNAYARIKNLQSRMGSVEDKNATQDTAIAKAQADATAAGNQANTNKGDIATLTSKFNDYYTESEIDAKIGTKPSHIDATTIYGAIDEVYSDLNAELVDHIKAANALTYKGGVTADSWKNIKDAAAEIGFVYVVTETAGQFDVNGTTKTCHAGDMFIATGTEVDGVLSDPTWIHVASGYQKEMQGKLALADVDGDSKAKVEVSLTSLNGAGAHGDLGQFTIESVSKNLEITTVSANDVVTGMKVQMVWDTF